MTSFSKVGLFSTLSTIIFSVLPGLTYSLSEKPKTIKEAITKAGRTLLNNDSKYWNIKLSTYKSEFENIVKLKNKNENGLKNWCFNAIKSSFKDKKDTDFEIAKKICTTPTYKEKLESKLKQLADESDWKEILKSYNSKKEGENFIKEINKGKATKKNLKKWCKKILKQEIPEEDKTYDAVEALCTKK